MSNHSVTIDGDVVRKRYRRTSRDEPAREWEALVRLDMCASGLAPRPIARDEDPPSVLMSRVDGTAMDTALSGSQTTAMVSAYRTLFDVPILPGMRPRDRPPGQALRYNIEWLSVEMGRKDLSETVRDALATAHAWHRSAPSELAEMRDPVLAQGDAKVDNMLWDGEVVRLIDFEVSGVSDLAYEVADVVEHISARLAGLRSTRAVIDGFGLDHEQHARLRSYRCVLATYWLLELLPANRGAVLNPAGSATCQAEHLLNLLEAADHH